MRKPTPAQHRILREIAKGRKIRTFRGQHREAIRILEYRYHYLRQGPESQFRYGPLTKAGERYLERTP